MADTGNPGSDNSPNQGNNTGSNTPTVIELKDDSMVRLPGAKEPVKWGEHNRSFQAEYTRKSQTAAEYEREKANWAKKEQESQNLLKRYQAELQKLKQGGEEDPFAPIAERTYLDGKTAYDLAKQLRNEINGIKTGELGKRDQALQLIVRLLQDQGKTIQELRAERANQSFETKISKWLKDADLDESWGNFAKNVYLAHEGDDLDEAFPELLKKAVEEVQTNTRTFDKRRMESRKQLPFTPGKGGNGSANKPLSLRGKSARDVADWAWDMIGDEARNDT